MIDKQRPTSRPNNRLLSVASNLEIDPLKLLRRYWPMIAVCVVIGWVAAGAYYVLTPPVYESQADLLLMSKNPGTASASIEKNRDVNNTLSDDLLATHMFLIQSNSIVDAALKTNGLADLPTLVAAKSVDDRNTTDYVVRKLEVTRGGDGKTKKAQVLRIAMQHTNAEDAQKVLTAIVSEFRKFIDKKYADVNASAAELITKAQDQLKTNLDEAESSYREFREEAPMLWNGEKSTNIFRQEYEQIESSLTDLRLQRSEVASRLQLVEVQLKRIEDENGGDIQKLALIDEKSAERVRIFLELYGGKADSQIFQATQPERLEAARGEYEGLLKMKTRLNSLISEFGVGHPEVSMLMKEIETTEAFFKARSPRLQVSNEQETLTPKSLIEGYVSILRHDLASLDDREKVLIERSKEVEIEAKHLVQFELQGESLRLSVDRQKALFDATVDRLREINLAKDFGGFINELVMEPEIGEEVWPKKSVCGLVGTFGGGLMGLMFGFLFELRNRTLRTLKDIETATGVPNVAMVPKFEQHKDRKARKAIAARKSRVAPIVSTYHFPDCKESELLRGLRTALFFKLSAEGAKVVGLTSPSPGDGKSTVTSNLAASIAQAGKSVLLIDADMRRPTQSRLFGETNQRGLADVLSRRSSLFESVVHTECPRLDLLTAGAPPSNPAELLASPEFNALVEQARNEYDVVLIDCPPVLAVTDACIVATHADSIMLVVKLNPNSRAELKRSMELLSEVKGNVVGTVLNCSRLESETGRKMDEYGVETYGYGSNRSYEYVRPIAVSRDVHGKKPNTVKTPEKTKVS